MYQLYSLPSWAYSYTGEIVSVITVEPPNKGHIGTRFLYF